MTEKNSFILYHDKLEILNDMSDEDAGKLIKAIYVYTKTGEIPPRGGIVSLAFQSIKPSLDANTERWKSIREKRSEAGRQGGRPSKNDKNSDEEESKKANAFSEKANDDEEKQKVFSEKQTKAKKAVTVTVTDTVTGTVTDTNPKKFDGGGDLARARARGEGTPSDSQKIAALQDEAKSRIAELCKESGDLIGVATAKVLRELAEVRSPITINKAEIPPDAFLRKLIDLVEAAINSATVSGSLVETVLNATYMYESGKITNYIAYLASAFYNKAMLL